MTMAESFAARLASVASRSGLRESRPPSRMELLKGIICLDLSICAAIVRLSELLGSWPRRVVIDVAVATTTTTMSLAYDELCAENPP